jgi:hypothetical protein
MVTDTVKKQKIDAVSIGDVFGILRIKISEA